MGGERTKAGEDGEGIVMGWSLGQLGIETASRGERG